MMSDIHMYISYVVVGVCCCCVISTCEYIIASMPSARDEVLRQVLCILCEGMFSNFSDYNMTTKLILTEQLSQTN